MAEVTSFTAAHILGLIGQSIVGVRTAGDNLILTTANGIDIDAGVTRGPSSTVANAAALPFTPAGTVAATNVQTALAEVAGDFTALNTAKVNKADLLRVCAGTIVHVPELDRAFPKDKVPVRTRSGYYTAFPDGMFNQPPSVAICVADKNVAMLDQYWSVMRITPRGFTLEAYTGLEPDSTSANFNQPINIRFNWMAVGAGDN